MRSLFSGVLTASSLAFVRASGAAVRSSLPQPSVTKDRTLSTVMPSDESAKSVIPVNIDGTVISDENEVAYTLGALHQAKLFYERTGAYESLWAMGCVTNSNGTTTVDSSEAVYLVSGIIPEKIAHTFMRPSPPLTSRVTEFDADAAASSTPTFNALKAGVQAAAARADGWSRRCCRAALATHAACPPTLARHASQGRTGGRTDGRTECRMHAASK